MRELVIFGGRGIGMIAASVATDLGSHRVLGFLNDDVPVGEFVGAYRKYQVLGTTGEYERFLANSNVDFFLGFAGMTFESRTFGKLVDLNIDRQRWATLIHPTAIVPYDYCRLGRGILLAPLAQLSPDVTLDDNSIVLGNAFVGHDSHLRRFAHVATNGVVGGAVDVGRGVHVGSNSVIRENVTIGDFALIGSGSVVLHDVSAGNRVAGNPARVIGKNS